MHLSEDFEGIRVMGFWRWVYARFFYRAVSRLLHRFSLHYAPEHRMHDGDLMRWCKWCGLRDVRKPYVDPPKRRR
jgi:hypothetical protein